MKYSKKRDRFELSNVSLTIRGNKVEAYSYNWWLFVKRIEQTVYLNNYKYSISTSKHQTRVRNMLNNLGIEYKVVNTGRASMGMLSTVKDVQKAIASQKVNEANTNEQKRIARNERARKLRAEKKRYALTKIECYQEVLAETRQSYETVSSWRKEDIC